MQDLAEEEIGEGESASQRTIGSATPLSFSTFKSKLGPYEEGGMVLKQEEFEELQIYVCPMCRTMIPYEYEVDEFRSLQQLSEHVKGLDSRLIMTSPSIHRQLTHVNRFSAEG